MHVDTGHNFPEVLEFRDRRGRASSACGSIVAQRAGLDRRRPGDRGDRAARVAQPAADRRRCSTRSNEHGFDAVFGGARRDEEKARAKERVFSLPRRVRPVGPEEPAARAVVPLQRPHRRGEHIRVFPLSNWTELDVWQYIAARSDRAARRSTSRTSARCSSATACCYAVNPFITLRRARRVRRATVRYRTVGDMTCTGAVRVERAHGRRGDRRGRRHPRHRARRDPRRRPGHRGRDGRPQARGLLLDGTMAPCRSSRPPARSTTASRTLIGRLLYDTKTVFEDQLAAVERRRTRRGDERRQPRAAHRRPAGRARAGHHDRRRLPLLRDAAAQVHHRRHARATCSTPATWSPAPRPRTSRSSWSTRATAWSSRSRRHAFLASLLRVPHLVLAVNKMDLVDYDEAVFRRIATEFSELRRAARHPGPHLHPDLAR